MSIWNAESYRQCLKQLISDRKASVPGFTMARLADHCKIQRTYLSHVISGRADLNSDQLFVVCKFLNLSPDERDFLMLLLDIERCQIADRREELQLRLDRQRSQYSDTERAIGYQPLPISERSLAAYYSNPMCSVIHMMLHLPEYRSDVRAMATHLHLSQESMQSVLDILDECRIIAVSAEGIVLQEANVHIRQDHPLSKNHALNFRNYAIQHNWQRQDPVDYQFTATVAADQQCMEGFREDVLAAIARLSAKVQKLKDSQTDLVFQINIDLFKI